MENNIFGVRLKNERKLHGYTQEELANSLRSRYNLKTDRAMVGKWEIGYQVPEMYTLKCLADLLDTTIDYLCGKTEPATDSDSGPIPQEDLELLKSLSKADRDILISVARQMKQKENERGQ